MKYLIILSLLFVTSISKAQVTSTDTLANDTTKVNKKTILNKSATTQATTTSTPTEKEYIPNYAPLSPNSSALQKFGDYSVNMATGVPNIEIPIYTVKVGNLSLPISLSYHAAGHKIDELASWVGWGWSLNTGGSLSRSINKIADDIPSSSSYLANSNFNRDPCNNANDYSVMEQARLGTFDFEPDLFSFSTPEGGAKFMLGHNQQDPFVIPWQPIKIKKNTVAGSSVIESFEIINPSGNLYFFGKDLNGNPVTESLINNGVSQGYPTDGVNAWHLTKVQSPNTQDSISITYQDGGQSTQTSISSSGSISFDNNGVPQSAVMIPETIYQTRTTTQKNIHKILFPEGEVEFIQSAPGQRSDISSGYYLNRINIYSSTDQTRSIKMI